MAKYEITRHDELILFRQLAMVYDSELSVPTGLELIAERSEDVTLKSILKEMALGALNGYELSAILAEADIGIREHELKLVELGERSGRLPRILSDMADSIEMELDLEKRLKSAIRYPAILTGLTLFVLAALVIVIVPVFESMLVEAGAQFGSFTAALFAFSRFINAYLFFVLGGLFLLIVLFYAYFKKSESGKKKLSRFWQKSFLMKNIIMNAEALSFVKNLSILIDSGMPPLEAFETIQSTLTSDVIKKDLDRAIRTLNEGGDFDEALRSFEMLPNLLLEIVGIASKTGHVVSSLDKAAKIISRDLDEGIEALNSKIEPILIIILSLVVAAVLLSGIIPIFGILDSIV